MALNQKTELQVTAYKAIAPPPQTDVHGLIQYLLKETKRLEASIQTLTNAAPQATAAAPLNPQNGMIRYAEGAWATTLGAVGLYVYKAGAWTHIV